MILVGAQIAGSERCSRCRFAHSVRAAASVLCSRLRAVSLVDGALERRLDVVPLALGGGLAPFGVDEADDGGDVNVTRFLGHLITRETV
jgi:hypothetical protein